jgi:hypothetical protein
VGKTNIENLLGRLEQHNLKLDEFIKLIEKMNNELNIEELRQYGQVSIHDKRSPNWVNYGHIIKRRIGVNGLELTTDRGYTLCLSGNCEEFDNPKSQDF